MFPVFLLLCGASLIGLLLYLALAGPSPARAQTRRLGAVRARHGSMPAIVEAQLRRITANRQTRMDLAFGKMLPNRAQLQKRLAMTGKSWTVGQYGGASAAMVVVVTLLLRRRGLPFLLALLVGLVIGLGLPHFFVGKTIQRRVGKFTTKFPDAIEAAGPRPALGSADLRNDGGGWCRGRWTGRRGVPLGVGQDEDRPVDGRRPSGNRRSAGHARIPVLRHHHRHPARDRRQFGRNAGEPGERTADAIADEAQDQGDVVGVESVGLYRRIAAIHRLRDDLVH